MHLNTSHRIRLFLFLHKRTLKLIGLLTLEKRKSSPTKVLNGLHDFDSLEKKMVLTCGRFTKINFCLSAFRELVFYAINQLKRFLGDIVVY